MTGHDESTRLEQALIGLDRATVAAVVRSGVPVDAGVRADWVDRVISSALIRIGEGWERGTVALSQVYMAGRILDEALREQFVWSGVGRAPGVRSLSGCWVTITPSASRWWRRSSGAVATRWSISAVA